MERALIWPRDVGRRCAAGSLPRTAVQISNGYFAGAPNWFENVGPFGLGSDCPLGGRALGRVLLTPTRLSCKSALQGCAAQGAFSCAGHINPAAV